MPWKARCNTALIVVFPISIVFALDRGRIARWIFQPLGLLRTSTNGALVETAAIQACRAWLSDLHARTPVKRKQFPYIAMSYDLQRAPVLQQIFGPVSCIIHAVQRQLLQLFHLHVEYVLHCL